MRGTGLDVFDTSVQKTNEWLIDIGARLHTDDRRFAYQCLRTVLHNLRDRLTANEAVHLGAQLPMLIRGLYYEGWQPGKTPEKFGREEFLRRIQNDLSKPRVDPERVAGAVLSVLRDRVSPGEMADVIAAMPQDLKSILAQRRAA